MIKYFHKNEVLAVFAILAIIFCQMFFTEYFSVLDDFAKSENNVVFKVQTQKYQDDYTLRYLRNYAMEYLDKITGEKYQVEDFIVVDESGRFKAMDSTDLSGELFGVLGSQTLEDLKPELVFSYDLDKEFKKISEQQENIEKIYYRSDNNFVLEWPKSTASQFYNMENNTIKAIAEDEDNLVTKVDDKINMQIGIYDKANQYFGIIGYDYKIIDVYKFLDSAYPCIIRNANGKIIYTNIDQEVFDSNTFSKIEKAFESSKDSNHKGEILVLDNKFYYVYMFDDGTQLLQYIKLTKVISMSLKATLPIVLIGLTYILYLVFKRNYEKENQRLQEAMVELDSNYEQLKIMASTDFLTGLYNRAGFTEVIMEFLEQNKNIVFAIADIDKFKNVNDTYGHEVGDLVLKEFAKTIKGCLSEEDAIGRWGGEEFVIAFTGVSEEQAYNLAENIREKILDIEIIIDEEQVVNISASFGVARHNNSISSIVNTIAQADEALYVSKNSGRNKVTKYSSLGL